MCLVKIYTDTSLSALSSYSNLLYFHSESNQWVIWCSEITCQRIALIGSLVQLNGDPSGTIFIVPFCPGHASSCALIDIGPVVPVPKFS